MDFIRQIVILLKKCLILSHNFNVLNFFLSDKYLILQNGTLSFKSPIYHSTFPHQLLCTFDCIPHYLLPSHFWWLKTSYILQSDAKGKVRGGLSVL